MQAAGSTRRDFIRGRFTHLRDDAIRPPGAVAGFADQCTGCGDCIAACPQDVILRDSDRRAVLNFSYGACTFCGECARACGEGALDPAMPVTLDWRAQIGTGCLSTQGITCRACEDACDTRAIRFRLELGGRSRPQINPDACNGCGACAHACPPQVITFSRPTPSQTETLR